MQGTKAELRLQSLRKLIKNTFRRCKCGVRISSNKETCLACKNS